MSILSKSQKAWLSIALMCLAASGCGSGSDDDDGAAPRAVTVIQPSSTAPAAGTVRPTGDTVSLVGIATATFPAGAFPSSREVTIVATTLPQAVEDFTLAGALFDPGVRSYEVHINTGASAPATDIELTINIPQQLLSASPNPSDIQVFAEIDELSSQELMSSFEVLPSAFDATSNSVTVTLPSAIFSDGRSAASVFEAIIILAPVPGSSTSRSLTPKATGMCAAEPIGFPLRRAATTTDGFNPSQGHNGVDFAAGSADTVISVSDGTVVANDFQERDCLPNENRCVNLGLTKRGAGHYVVVKHSDGNYSVYFHLVGVAGDGPKVGRSVRKGDALGQSDSTGGVTGPHLHFEYRTGRFKSQIDPEPCFVGSFDGTYTSTELFPDGFTHTENGTVAGFSVSLLHQFSKGDTRGSFQWTGTITPRAGNPREGDVTGQGMIDNAGMRPFTLEDGDIEIFNDGSAELCWSATDPRFGPIGGCSRRPPQ